MESRKNLLYAKHKIKYDNNSEFNNNNTNFFSNQRLFNDNELKETSSIKFNENFEDWNYYNEKGEIFKEEIRMKYILDFRKYENEKDEKNLQENLEKNTGLHIFNFKDKIDKNNYKLDNDLNKEEKKEEIFKCAHIIPEEYKIFIKQLILNDNNIDKKIYKTNVITISDEHENNIEKEKYVENEMENNGKFSNNENIEKMDKLDKLINDKDSYVYVLTKKMKNKFIKNVMNKYNLNLGEENKDVGKIMHNIQDMNTSKISIIKETISMIMKSNSKIIYDEFIKDWK